MCNFRVIKRMLCPNESDQEIAPITTILKFIGVTLAVISFIFVFFLLNHVLGILGTLIIHNNHDISTGCPKTNPQNCDSAEKTMCNFGSNESLWAMCMLSGYICILVIGLIMLLLKLIISISDRMYYTKSIYISEGELLKLDGKIVLFLASAVFWPVTILLGIAFTWIIYGKDYDIKSGDLFCNLSSPGSIVGRCGMAGLIPDIVIAAIICLIKSTIYHYHRITRELEKDDLNINNGDV